MRIVYLIAGMCVAEVFSMAPFATFPALLPTFIDEWGLSNTEAGWISSVFYAGYLVSVPILVSLTDHHNPKPIYLICMLLSGFSAIGFPLLATGLWSAVLLRVVAGVGLAGTYMPGLKALSDLIEGPAQSRAVSFYTSSFGIGSSLSFYMAGRLAGLWDWKGAFYAASIGPFIAIPLVMVILPRRAGHSETPAAGSSFNFLRVIKNRRAMGYVMCYAMHNFELFGFRSWIVAFLAYSQRLKGVSAGFIAPTSLAALANLVGLPASVIGNELAVRVGRRKVVVGIMLCSAVFAGVLGFTAQLPFTYTALLCIVYGLFVTGDSSPITAGAIAEAEPGFRGTTMAVHSSIGFMGSFLGPIAFGWVLDQTGAGASVFSWGMAFLSMGIGVALGPAMMGLLSHGVPPRQTPIADPNAHTAK